MLESDIEAVRVTTAATSTTSAPATGCRRTRIPTRPWPTSATATSCTPIRTAAGCPRTSRGSRACAIAIRREGIWGLSLLIVRPDQQSAGVGSALLRRANEYADGARGRIIMSSPDTRALRAYSRLGLDLHPSLDAYGVPRNVAVPDGIREGGPDDIPFTNEVDAVRARRCARRGYRRPTRDGPDAADRARPRLRRHRGGRGAAAGGFDDDAASDLLRAALARAGERKAIVSWMTSSQQWRSGCASRRAWS